MKYKNLGCRIASLMALFCAVFFCSTAYAQEQNVKLYIPDFTVDSYEPVTVNIMLDNDQPVTAFSFNIEMPAGLEIVPGSVSTTTPRYKGDMELQFGNNVFFAGGLSGKTFSGNSGSVGTFQVKAADGTLGQKTEKEIKLTKVTVNGPKTGTGVSAKPTVYISGETLVTKVTVLDGSAEPISVTLTSSPASKVANPKCEVEISLALENKTVVNGLQLDVVLPTGFTFVADEDEDVFFPNKARLAGTISASVNNNSARVSIVNIRTNEVLQPGTGDFMSFKVAVPENFTAEQAEVLIKGIEATVNVSQTITADDITVTIINGKQAYDKAKGEVASLKANLATALETIKTTCPDVAENFPGTDISGQITALESAIDAAYADLTLTGNYDTVMAPAADIAAAIEKLVADAQAAQKAAEDDAAAKAALEAAKAKADTAVADLEKALADALATIAKDCPDVKDQFTGADITSQIAALKGAVKAAYEDGSLTENYDTVMAPAADITAAIQKLVADAKAAQKAAVEAAALEKARKDANTTLAGLDKALADALVEIEKTCPDVKHLYTGTSIQQQITVLRNAVNTAYENKTLATDYETVMAPAADITAAITKLVADAKAAQKAADDAAAALQAAKVKADAAVAALETAFKNALQTIATECPDVKDLFPGTGIQTQITELKAAVAAAYADKSLATNYDNVMANEPTIKAAIEKLVADAKAAQKAGDDEKAAQIARDQAYANANASVAALQKALADALQTIATECPDVKDQFKGEAITADINKMKAAIDAAYADKTIIEKLESLLAPSKGIEAAIAQLVADAKAAQKKVDDASAALTAAKAKADAEVAALEKALADALQTIATECPNVKGQFPGTEISNQIATLKGAVKAAFEDGSLTEKYDTVMAPAAAITAAIEKLVADAKAAQKAADAQSALDKARTNANAQLASLDKALAEALQTIATECPDVKHLYTGSAIQQQITVLRNAVNAAYENKTLVEKYNEVMAPAANIVAEINKMVEDAKAAQKAIDDAENARQKYNAEAYAADLAAIAELEEELATAKAEIVEKYPDYDYTKSYNKIVSAIATLKTKVEREKERVATEGRYSYSVDKLPVQEMIEKMLAEAQAAGVEDILVDGVSGEDRIFTLDGKQVPALQPGKVNIIVKADGTTKKVFIK